MVEGKQNVAVIGGGLMGCGIAFVFAFGGHAVTIVEPNEANRNAIPEKIKSFCGLLDISFDEASTVYAVSTIDEIARGAALVVEAVPESLELKQSIFHQLDELCGDETILATNTSALPISKVAERVRNKTRVVGMHFWNPPHLVELVEVILGPESDPSVGDRAVEILADVGMTPVLVKKDVPGFIGNRLQHALKREAIALVANGVCDAQTLDTVVKLGFGARLSAMGPLEQSDLLGLELTLAIHETLMPELDVTAEPHPYLKQRIASGKVGAKVGEGFRQWTAAEADAARARLNRLLTDAAKGRYARRPRGKFE